MRKIWSHIVHLYTIALVVSVAGVGCDDYLEEIPDNRVELNTLDKAAQVLTNGYPVASPAFTDWMTDDFQFTFNTNIRPEHEQMYKWEEVTNGSPDVFDTPDFYWFETYNSIAHANEVLDVLDELPVETQEDEEKRDAIEGEAKLIRAYGHFMLVNMFGEHYSSQTRSSPGVPYIKTPETKFLTEYKRSSVGSVYDQVENDLQDGLELIRDNFFLNSGKYHFNRNAALAFASRFYLYKRDFIRCLQYSNQLLGNNPEDYVRDMTSDEYLQKKSSVDGYPQLYNSPDEPANFLLMRKLSLFQRLDFAYAIPNQAYSSLFGSNPFPGTSDERENPAFIKGTDVSGNQGIFPLRYESLFQRSSINSNVGTPYHVGVMLRGEEVLFNRMECNLIQNNLDEVLSDMNVLFKRRYGGKEVEATMESLRIFMGAEDNPNFSDQDVLFNMFLVEKHKEFIVQGLYWFDAKRYGIPQTHILQTGTTITLDVDDPRWVMQIPTAAVQVGGLEPNDR